MISEPLARAQHRMEFGRARHQAHQIDFQHLAKAVHFEFAAAVDHRALRQHQHVELFERRLQRLDRLRIADVELEVVETFEMRTFVRRIIGCACAGAADGHMRALGAEGLRDAVADAAGAADHQHLPAAEIQFVHPCDPSRSSISGCRLTCLRIGASLVNPATRTALHSRDPSCQISNSSAARSKA